MRIFLICFWAFMSAFIEIAIAEKAIPVLGSGYEFENNGKTPGPDLKRVYTPATLYDVMIEPNQHCLEAAILNLRHLSRSDEKRVFSAGNLKISATKLQQTGQTMVKFLRAGKNNLSAEFKFFKIKGEDGRGNVHYTGYFTPLLEARLKPDKTYRFPIYEMPRGQNSLPSRAEIDQGGALAGKGLELAYTSDILANYFLHVQGSGVLRFANGQLKRIGFAGQNGYSYKSLGRMLVAKGAISPEKISLMAIRNWFREHPKELVPMLNNNPSYTFFEWRKSEIVGGAGVQLSDLFSVAVDQNYIPYGACLLGKVPILNEDGVLISHEWRILFAHDTGGAIRGPGHLDIYFGLGTIAETGAGNLHHYGQLWLLLAK